MLGKQLITRTWNSAGKRYLHRPAFFTQNKISKVVVVGNNSMLFATMDALRQHGHESYPSLVFCYPKFWLDDMHSDYYDLDWGQTKDGLPKTLRNRLKRLKPNFPDDKYLTWGIFQEIRMSAKNELHLHTHAEVYEGEPTDVASENNLWRIKLHNGQEIAVPNDSFFYTWYRKPRMGLRTDDGLRIGSPHTRLYSMPRSQVPSPMFIIGHGLSLVWLLKHFPDHKIINFKLPRAIAKTIPSNGNVSIDQAIATGRLDIYMSDKYTILPTKSGQAGNLIHLGTSNMVFQQAVPIFVADGIAIQDPLSKIPKERRLLAEDPPTKNDNGGFVAPSNLPSGSLPQTYAYLMHLTDNASLATEPMFYYRKNQEECLINKAKEFGIRLTSDYFDIIDRIVSSLANPLNYEQAISLYLAEFKKLYEPNNSEYLNFEQCLEKVFNEYDYNARNRYPKAQLRRMYVPS